MTLWDQGSGGEIRAYKALQVQYRHCNILPVIRGLAADGEGRRIFFFIKPLYLYIYIQIYKVAIEGLPCFIFRRVIQKASSRIE